MTNELFILFSFIIPSQIAISHDMDISPYILETKGQQFLFQQRLFLNYSNISVFSVFLNSFQFVIFYRDFISISQSFDLELF